MPKTWLTVQLEMDTQDQDEIDSLLDDVRALGIDIYVEDIILEVM
jgi:hypothetical protein